MESGSFLLSPTFEDRARSSVSTLLLSVVGVQASDPGRQIASASGSASASTASFEPLFSLVDVTENDVERDIAERHREEYTAKIPERKIIGKVPAPSTLLREGSKGSVQQVHNLSSRALRIYAMDFMRVFYASPVPVTVFGLDDSEGYCTESARVLILFAQCRHGQGNHRKGMGASGQTKSDTNCRNDLNAHERLPCNCCSEGTLTAAFQCRNSAPSASNLAMELCRIAPTSPTYAELAPSAAAKTARILAFAAASVIGTAIEASRLFREQFECGQMDSSKAYNESY